jgi:PTH1 family peptidyl-tRNA hydrolase
MLLLVGLGNPGSDYANNRHNIGFMAIDAIAKHYTFRPFSKKFHGLISEGLIDGVRVLALKPATFMNESGRSVAAVCSFFKIPTEQIVVLHDEIDLVAANVRVKRGGGHAGHNGLRSIHEHIGPNYVRIRMGIGHPGNKKLVAAHVLEDFSKTDGKWVKKVLNAISKNAILIISECDSEFMRQVATEINPPKIQKVDKNDGF